MLAILYWDARSLIVFCLLLSSLYLSASESFSERAQLAYATNRLRFQTESTNAVAAWQFGRACYDWAEYAADNHEREKIAREGIGACRQSIALQSRSAAAHYYLGMNLGQLARTKSLGALKLIDEMETEFKHAAELDAKFDYAGPDRSLGLLYLQAPGWPTSIGNRAKARLHLERTVTICPEFPENHLCLLEAYLKWDDKKSIAAEAEAVALSLANAKERFQGDTWTATWLDWEQRWSTAQKTIKAKAPSKNKRGDRNH